MSEAEHFIKPPAADLANLALCELSASFARGTLSPIEVTAGYLDRISTVDTRLNAFVEVWRDEGLFHARESARRWHAGQQLGPLDGIPLALKDLFHVQGHATGCGSALYQGRRTQGASSAVAGRLRAAGAVLLGRTHMVELAFGGWGTHQTLGTPRNPWDMATHRVPGGSSSGSAVAVAAGLAAAALGTDTGGSVRIPSAFCGLTGLKTTQGRISRFGMELLSPTLDTIGPMARSAEDAAHLLQVLHGPDSRDDSTKGTSVDDFVAGLHRPVAGLRFRLLHDTLDGETEPAVQRAVDHCAQLLRGLGLQERDAGAPTLNLAAEQAASETIIAAEAYAAHGAAIEACTVSGDTAARARVLRGAHVDAAAYRGALQQRSQAMRAFQRVFDDVDLLLLPTVQIAAPPLAEIDEQSPVPSRMTRFVGYYGLCAIALPAGLDARGLPISVQLVAAPFQEALLLQVGAAWQRETTFHRLRAALKANAIR